MKSINIYALTRLHNNKDMQRLERQMSGRTHPLHIKAWEIDGLRLLCSHLQENMPGSESLEFFYSFQIPKLGKEFDLLRIGSETVINIELKSGNVSDEAIRRQLKQNRHYLSTLDKTVRSYTFISGEDRLVRLSGSGRIVDTSWEQVCLALSNQKNPYTGDVEELFREESYIISPFLESDRFLNQNYFLTSQQKDIERRILKKIRTEGACFQGITGLPGTGKTLLLYDIALKLSERRNIAVIHCGRDSGDAAELGRRLKRIAFLTENEFADMLQKTESENRTAFTAILIDEAHMMKASLIDSICSYAAKTGAPIIFSYDQEDVISDAEMDKRTVEAIEGLSCYTGYRITNRIRANEELSSFAQHLFHSEHGRSVRKYPHVSVCFAGNRSELETLQKLYEKRGYTFLTDPHEDRLEYSSVTVLLDQSFYVDEKGYLRNLLRNESTPDLTPVRDLFRLMGRAKSELALIIYENEPLMDHVLGVLQGAP